MKLGFLSGSLQDIEKAGRLGFPGIEMSAGALGNAAAGPLDPAKIAEAKSLCRTHGVTITALAYYDAAGNPPADFGAAYGNVFTAAEQLGVNTVTSMSGFDSNLDWNGNVQLWADRFGPVAQLAETRGMRVAFENWMGCGGPLPLKPINMGGAPDTWDAWFKAVPSKALGLEFDPSHLYWQGIDHIRALFEFKERIYHVHAKDTEMIPENQYRGGINGYNYRFRIPGYGEINWTRFISALDEIGYAGGVAIEHEDPVYWGPKFDEGLVRGHHVLYPLIHPKVTL